MPTKLSILVLSSSLAFAGPALAAGDSPSAEENIGVGAGLVVGALAGGPVGAVLGAAAGAKLGDTLHRRKSEADELSARLEQSRAELGGLEKELARLARHNRELDSSLDRLRATARPELVSLLQAGIEMDLLFRTDEHVLAADTEARMAALATTIASMPDLRIRIEGYSDERGDEAYNQTLSERRASHVRDLLVAGGIPQGRIRVQAHGESPASEAHADSYALQRRVSLTLSVDPGPSLAAGPAN